MQQRESHLSENLPNAKINRPSHRSFKKFTTSYFMNSAKFPKDVNWHSDLSIYFT